VGKTKRVVALGDFHCGHYAGLTPPGWHVSASRNKKIKSMQSEMWRNYLGFIKESPSPDLLIVNGDLIDGKGGRSGGTELITCDLMEQAEMAAECVKPWNARKVVMTYGTPYHVAADGEDVEKYTAALCGAEIHGHCFPEVEGVVFDVKHKLGSSQIPWSRHTAVARERYQNLFWKELGNGQPQANVILRSHVHFFGYCGGTNWLAITLPALQSPKTKFGGRQCSGTVDWGCVQFDVGNGVVQDWRANITTISACREKVIKC